MESVIFRAFGVAFKAVGILLLTGVFISVLTDIQNRAFDSKKRGLVSMLRVNQQLVGKAR